MGSLLLLAQFRAVSLAEQTRHRRRCCSSQRAIAPWLGCTLVPTANVRGKWMETGSTKKEDQWLSAAFDTGGRRGQWIIMLREQKHQWDKRNLLLLLTGVLPKNHICLFLPCASPSLPPAFDSVSQRGQGDKAPGCQDTWVHLLPTSTICAFLGVSLFSFSSFFCLLKYEQYFFLSL